MYISDNNTHITSPRLHSHWQTTSTDRGVRLPKNRTHAETNANHTRRELVSMWTDGSRIHANSCLL